MSINESSSTIISHLRASGDYQQAEISIRLLAITTYHKGLLRGANSADCSQCQVLAQAISAEGKYTTDQPRLPVIIRGIMQKGYGRLFMLLRLLRIPIPFTPRTPHTKRVRSTLIMLFMPVCSILHAQETTGPFQPVILDSVAVYERSYQSFMVVRWKAERREFTAMNRNKWWYYLPTFGVSLRSPLAHVNTGVLAQIDHDRILRAAKLESMDARYQVEFTETVARIRIEHRKLLVRSAQLERERRLLTKLYSIQVIHNEAFNTQHMAPVDHLQVSYAHEKALSDFESKRADYTIAVLDFFTLCRFDMPDMPMVPLADSDCPAVRREVGGFEVVGIGR